MPNPTQPSVLPIWTQGNNSARTQPSNGEQFTGFYPNFRPPSGWHNWLFGIFSDWIVWFNFITSPANKTLVATTATALGSPVSTFMGNPDTSGSFPATLPSAAANAGYKVAIVNIGLTNSMTVVMTTGDYLQGTLNGTKTLGPGEVLTLASDGTAGYWNA